MMRIFNEDKTQEIQNPDLELGYTKKDKLFLAHHEAQEEIQQQSHYEVIAEYPNGGKDLEEVIDVEYQPAKEAWDEYEDILVYTPFTEEELRERKIQELRYRRQSECFSVINRGQLWYDKLTAEQRTELSVWYEAWLDAPQTMVAPELLPWLNSVAKQK